MSFLGSVVLNYYVVKARVLPYFKALESDIEINGELLFYNSLFASFALRFDDMMNRRSSSIDIHNRGPGYVTLDLILLSNLNLLDFVCNINLFNSCPPVTVHIWTFFRIE